MRLAAGFRPAPSGPLAAIGEGPTSDGKGGKGKGRERKRIGTGEREVRIRGRDCFLFI